MGGIRGALPARRERSGEGAGHVGYGAAISVAIFLIIALFVIIYVTFMRVTADE